MSAKRTDDLQRMQLPEGDTTVPFRKTRPQAQDLQSVRESEVEWQRVARETRQFVLDLWTELRTPASE